ncbi:MAG: hypothetical protein ACT4PI_14150 [Actinomycetota bacterium]
MSVQLRERPFSDVAADMVEGVLVVNQLRGEAATRMRAALKDVVAPIEVATAA